MLNVVLIPLYGGFIGARLDGRPIWEKVARSLWW